MAFIEKKDPVVLNIKLTSKGRELLSKGKLTFNYFAVGDSEIDYKFNKDAGFNPFYSNILRPADKNPEQLSFITKNLSGESYNEISAVPCTPTIIENHIQPIGFFNDDATEFLTDSNHVKQPDVMVKISGVTGGTQITLNQAPTYQANVNEPSVGDILMIKWTTPEYLSGDTTGYTINKDYPTPYLFYKIEEILSGTLANNNLVVKLDREVPNFSFLSSSSNLAGGIVFYNYINFSGDSSYSTDDVDEALLAFLQNCQCPTVTFPFWNMSIIFTENIVGVKTSDKQYGEYNTNGFGGFVSYIQNQAKKDENYKRKLGVIHYTNNSVANTYAEGFYGDPKNSEDLTPIDKIPRLDIPFIMWHKSSGTTLGTQLRATGKLKYLSGATKSLNARYYDLADPSGNVVGKVFYGLKIFLIEDQELLFAMSYKSNRSWSLPEHEVDINANVTFGCPECQLEYITGFTSPSVVGGNDGQLHVYDIEGHLGDFDDQEILLKVISGATLTPSGYTGNTIFFDSITGDTTIKGLSADDYYTEMYDIVATNCVISGLTTITDIETELNIVDTDDTSSSLISYFSTSAYNENPSRLRISQNTVAPSGFYGVGYVTIVPTGTTPNWNNNNTGGTNLLTGWVEIPNGGYVETSSLTQYESYIIYVRDVLVQSGETINSQKSIDTQAWSFHVAVTNPFDSQSNINVTTGNDAGGNYVTISDYIIGEIFGDIEMSVHKVGEPAFTWQSTTNDGSASKLYHNLTGNLVVSIRERVDYITAYKITTNNFTQ